MTEHAWTADEMKIPLSRGAERWRRVMRSLRWLTALAVFATAVLVAVGRYPDWQCGGVSDGGYEVRMVDGECLGVTDGSFVFDDRFEKIEGLIEIENDWAAAQAEADDQPLVKIALLTTLTTTDSSAMSGSKMQSALEGAYVALYRANRTRELGDHQPYIQLLLANEGARQRHWEVPVGQLLEMTDDEVPLVAVMGQSVSSENTMAAAERLSEHGIPMVTGVTTADAIDYDGVPGLIRTAPSNSDFAAALRAHLEARADLESAMLVYDSTAQDLYVSNLRTTYEAHLGEYLVSAHQPFVGRSIAEGGPEVFDLISTNICDVRPDVVLFAGREPDLKVFIEALSVRSCRDEPLTVLFGVTGTHLHSDAQIAEWVEIGNLEVLFAAGSDPGWAMGHTEPPEGFAAFHSHYRNLVDSEPSALFDGYAATYHDALAIAIAAVRNTDPWSDRAPAAEDVREHLLLLNSEQVVRGATGTLNFSINRGGNPGGKFVPVVPLPYPDEPGDRANSETYVTSTE
ncbi:hypothetical protein GCM10027447_22520 [Glycomyces halotolerans]